MAADQGFWVFGYGSLIWRPGFEFVERRRARLDGFRRAFCLRSIRYRGTPEAPGLVLALDRRAGASCEGVAFRVAPEAAEEARAYLRFREMDTDSYLETFQTVHIADHGPSPALCYVINEAHEHYALLTLEEQAEIILRSQGPAGPNREYLHNTVSHLRELGVEDEELEALDRLVQAREAVPARREG